MKNSLHDVILFGVQAKEKIGIKCNSYMAN